MGIYGGIILSRILNGPASHHLQQMQKLYFVQSVLFALNADTAALFSVRP